VRMMARNRTDLPVPADPVKKMFSPCTTRASISACCGLSFGPMSASEKLTDGGSHSTRPSRPYGALGPAICASEMRAELPETTLGREIGARGDLLELRSDTEVTSKSTSSPSNSSERVRSMMTFLMIG
jgi:hypothetical protein